MSLVLLMVAAFVWKPGPRKVVRLNREIQNASIERNSRQFRKLTDGGIDQANPSNP
jgi:hypothetical protein